MSGMITHAGCVAFRQSNNRTLYLVVSSSNGKHWVLPKGHIESGESQEAAALREMAEEAGVTGRIVAALSVQHHRKKKKEAFIQYFLVQAVGSAEAREQRVVRWEDEHGALKLLTFEDAKAVLREASTAVGQPDPKQ